MRQGRVQKPEKQSILKSDRIYYKKITSTPENDPEGGYFTYVTNLLKQNSRKLI